MKQGEENKYSKRKTKRKWKEKGEMIKNGSKKYTSNERQKNKRGYSALQLLHRVIVGDVFDV
jgi:hypothetical protein